MSNLNLNPAMMMATSEETIKKLQEKVLRLSVKLKHKEDMLDQMGRPPEQNLDETKRDLIVDLMTTNDDLRKQIQELNAKGQEQMPESEPSEPEKPQMFDIACQTNLDRLNIEQLIEASLALKRLKRQQLQQQEQLIQERQEALHKQQQQQPMYHNHYLDRPPSLQSGNQMSEGEKESLDKLFKLDGLLTTARDRLRAVALN